MTAFDDPTTTGGTSRFGTETGPDYYNIRDASSKSNHHRRPFFSNIFSNQKSPQKKNDDNDDDETTTTPPPKPSPPSSFQQLITSETTTSTSAFPAAAFLKLTTRMIFGTTIVLYLLNQKHMLPKPISRVVSKALFWPTMPITLSLRIGKWITNVDDVVVIGGAPFGFWNIPERLYRDYDVRGVINMCDEYQGPVKKYKELGMRHLWLRTVDHFEPSVEDLKSAISFLKEHETQNKKVYIHCRAGHGRSAAVTFAWLLYKHSDADPQTLNEQLCQIRYVRKYLWRQTNIREFHSWLKQGGRIGSRTRGGATSSSSSLGRRNDFEKRQRDLFGDEDVRSSESTTLASIEGHGEDHLSFLDEYDDEESSHDMYIGDLQEQETDYT